MKDSQSLVPLLSEEALQCVARSRECELTSGVHLDDESEEDTAKARQCGRMFLSMMTMPTVMTTKMVPKP